jgi:hypothetical protein
VRAWRAARCRTAPRATAAATPASARDAPPGASSRAASSSCEGRGRALDRTAVEDTRHSPHRGAILRSALMLCGTLVLCVHDFVGAL